LRLSRFVGKMGPQVERNRHGRKLLIASIGVAAVSYVACAGDDTTPGGSDAGATGGGGALLADGGATGGGGGLVADGSTAADAEIEQILPGFDVLVANLMISPTDR
jgi:hypothetical protein